MRIAAYLNIPLTQDALTVIAQSVTFEAMRERALDAEGSSPSAFKEGARTFYFKGTNGRWRDVLSAEEVALYEAKVSQLLTPDCRAWLEQGWAALGDATLLFPYADRPALVE